jgi:hypothetical protein
VRITADTHEVLDPLHGVGPFHPACRLTEANVPFGISSPLPLDRDATRPLRMLELPVAPFRRHQHPAIGLEEPHHRTHLHATTLPQPLTRVGQRPAEAPMGIARWVGLGVSADNLMSTAQFAGARPTA